MFALNMVIVVLFIIGKIQKNPKCPSKEYVCVCVGGVYTYIYT